MTDDENKMRDQQPSDLQAKHFDKEKFEALEVLRKGAWEKFSSRRPLEWKACLALWALLAAVAVILLEGKINVNVVSRFVITVVGIIIFGIHILWLTGLARATTIDQNAEHDLRNKMLSAINFTWTDKTKQSMARWHGGNVLLKNWSQVTQGAITMVLVVFVILLVWFNK